MVGRNPKSKLLAVQAKGIGHTALGFGLTLTLNRISFFFSFLQAHP